MNKKWMIGGLLVAAVIGVAVFSRMNKKEPFARAVSDPIVEITKPEKRDIRLTTGLVGQVEPETVVYVYPKASGEVTAVNVKAGETVSEGDILCSIDTKQVTTAKSSYDSAALQLKQAQEELARQTVLYNGGGISQQAFNQYQDSVTSAEINYNNAKTNYENQLSYSEIKAPISGIVEICNIAVYDTVSAQNLVCVISAQGAKTVSFATTERIWSNLSVGDVLSIEKDGQSYNGTITEIASMADSSSGLFDVKAVMSDNVTEGVLPTGSRVKLYVISEKSLQTMSVPVDAVYYDGGVSYIYTYDREAGVIHKLAVETGIYDSEYIEVLDGLTYDDEVLTTWTSELYEGIKVRIKGEASAQAASDGAAAGDLPAGAPGQGPRQ